MLTQPKERRIFGPLRSAEGASTVALRGLVNDLGPQKATEIVMDQQQKLAIGERIRELRNDSPQSNRSIAEFVGIGERAVAEWMRGGGISYENAEKVADLFNVDVQWLLSGREREPGSLDGGATALLHQMNAKLDEILEWIETGESVEDAVGADLQSAPSSSRSETARTSTGSRGKAR